ncbi:MAG: NifU family protein [Chitinophagales bacterium]|nr:NifU family protein [Chitinophagales bacterium]MDW8419343.1 NifU family protein [Chitinophagales bacterium]
MTDTEKILQRVEESLNTMRPYLRDDGGDVEVVELTKDMVVKVKLLGACSSCPQSYMTMKAGIEDAVKRMVPEIKSVIAIE